MKYALYFQNSKHERRPIGMVESVSEAMKEIKKFLKQYPNFTSYYTRVWYHSDDNETWFDVGSHIEFFVASGKLEGAPE